MVRGLAAAMLYRVFCQRIRSVQSGSVHIHFNDWTNGTPNDSAAGQAAQRPRQTTHSHEGITILEIFSDEFIFLWHVWPTWLVEVHSWCQLPLEEDCRPLSSLWPGQESWTWLTLWNNDRYHLVMKKHDCEPWTSNTLIGTFTYFC